MHSAVAVFFNSVAERPHSQRSASAARFSRRPRQQGQLTLAYPADVPTWDPNARSLAPVQSLYKMVFDQPLTQGTGHYAASPRW